METTDRSDVNGEAGVCAPGAAQLGRLVYELLDAHDDTTRLASSLAGDDVRWAAHLAYVRDLQRVGRELLAHVGAEAR